MNQQQRIEALAQRMSDCGRDTDVVDVLAALGMVVTQALMQLQPEERMPGTIAWVAVLAKTMTDNYKKGRAN